MNSLQFDNRTKPKVAGQLAISHFQLPLQRNNFFVQKLVASRASRTGKLTTNTKQERRKIDKNAKLAITAGRKR